jgi:hypothetical protein
VTDLRFDGKPLGEESVEQLLHMADEIGALAATAITKDAKQALERLAARFRVFAASRATVRAPSGPAVKPGEAAPSAGVYELRNMFGSWVGDIVQVAQGESLPRAPHEFSWHLTTPARPS